MAWPHHVQTGSAPRRAAVPGACTWINPCLFFQQENARASRHPHHAHARHGLCTTAFSTRPASASQPCPCSHGSADSAAPASLNFFEHSGFQRQVVQLSHALHNFLWIKTAECPKKRRHGHADLAEKRFSTPSSVYGEVCRFSAQGRLPFLENRGFPCGHALCGAPIWEFSL